MADGDVDLNPDAMRDAESAAGGSGELGAMREKFIGIASARGLFGSVPGGAEAEGALESAARTMLTELEAAGLTVGDIQASAGEAAGIADETDAAAGQRLAGAQEAVGYFDGLMNSGEGGGGQFRETY
ncbi:hypothetical protein SAMN06297387_11594 [Streptomyces zhaozhouensis]|uniref:Excreted virulence factor EspC, type VII ESX diderm n=1 Tax=Streptomyces zhaozhouensis TaxID=1300267 RepID=A0A286E045_9ACTN|nr:hypothetical protein [Streptomyces zhaozhouensis]SOD64234.1 hypothetical protein SAMN06297387_11594 [Streptomyces zhaozhouensis]